MTILLVIAGLAIIGLLYVVFNLLRKVEVYEEFCQTLTIETEYILNEVDKIDIRGAFKSDDEVGLIYNAIRTMFYRLHTFTNIENL